MYRQCFSVQSFLPSGPCVSICVVVTVRWQSLNDTVAISVNLCSLIYDIHSEFPSVLSATGKIPTTVHSTIWSLHQYNCSQGPILAGMKEEVIFTVNT